MYATGTDSGLSTRFDLEMRRILGSAPLRGRWELSFLAGRLYGRSSPGLIETAELIARKPNVAATLIRVANTVHAGAGIAATNLQAAVVRLGHPRAKSLALAKQIEQILAETIGASVDLESFWRTALARGALARAVAMNSHRSIASEAFLVGVLQDVGAPFLARAYGERHARLVAESKGQMLRLAILEWQALNLNHIHVARSLLSSWALPAWLIEAVGRHHTNPPITRTKAPALALWQIGHFAGSLPLACSSPRGAYDSALTNLAATAFDLRTERLADLIRQASEEFADVSVLFEFPRGDADSIRAIFEPAAASLGLNPAAPSDAPDAPRQRRSQTGEDRRLAQSIDPIVPASPSSLTAL